MILQINFSFNSVFPYHKDIFVNFLSESNEEIYVGDSYHFLNSNDSSYENIIERILSFYKIAYNKLKNLPDKRTYFWFFFVLDGSKEGFSITNIDNNNFQIEYVVEVEYTDGSEYIFENDKNCFVDKALFLKNLKDEIERNLRLLSRSAKS